MKKNENRGGERVWHLLFSWGRERGLNAANLQGCGAFGARRRASDGALPRLAGPLAALGEKGRLSPAPNVARPAGLHGPSGKITYHPL